MKNGISRSASQPGESIGNWETTPSACGWFKSLSCRIAGILLTALIAACGGGSSDSVEVHDPTSTADRVVSVIARTGPIIGVRVGDSVMLDGSRSTTSSSQALQFSWAFSSRPHGSAAVLLNAASANPGFVADTEGTYMVQLLVSAEGVRSRRAVQLVVATVAPDRMTGPFNHQGLSSVCADCHNDEFAEILSKSQIHLAAGNTCQACHTPLGFDQVPYVDHSEVFGACSECHNGVVAVGMSDFHPQTAAECDDCHNTNSFLALQPDGSFDHTGITRSCSGCHNGTVSVGKTPNHPETDSECGYCHTTSTFLFPYPDHTGPDVVGPGVTCDSCHGVGQVSGQPPGHPLTNVDCGICHSVVSFSLDGVFNHQVVDPSIQPCESCHNETNGINAPTKLLAVPPHPPTTADCGNCHNTDSFAGAFLDHTGIVDNCASCHGVTASGMPTDGSHMVTTQDCSVCHTPGSFASGTYDHAGVINNCASCHNNVISVGKLFNHLPTTADCVICHNTTSFSDATFDHAGIINNCASCHDGGISTGKPANHVPTTLDCSSCHDIGNFTSFAGITYNHLGIDPANCASCHDSGIATAKKTNHIPTQDDCSLCHTSTTSFLSSTFLATQHGAIDRGCEGCHVERIFPGQALFKAPDHLPTAQDCYLCHSNAVFSPSIFSHTGISGNCASCHDGNPAHVAVGARGKTDTPIHQNTSGDCAVCHNTVNFADAHVDHSGPEVTGSRCDSCHNGIDATGMDAKVNPPHVVTAQDCGVCHVPGGSFAPAVFNHTGIVDNCASCHNGIDATGMDAKVNPPHVPTTQDCSVCHTPVSFAGAKFNHQGIVGNCRSCHDGNTAPGKGSNHVPTNGDCASCHVTTGFLPAIFDHQGIVDNCSSCHAAGFATGKKAGHVATIQDCGVCHSTRAFIPATFDHTGITGDCASCHGVSATGKPPDHLPTSLDCGFCHTTATFIGGSWAHDSSTAGRCDDCHSNTGGATAKPPGHFSTTVQCDQCHSTESWAPTSFSHDPRGNYPGNHRIDPGCAGCHGSVVTIPFVYRWPQYAPFCAACHANDFESEGDHNGGRSGTVEQNKDCSGGGRGCHRVSDSGF